MLRELVTSSPGITAFIVSFSPSLALFASTHVYFGIKQLEPRSCVGVCISLVPGWGGIVQGVCLDRWGGGGVYDILGQRFEWDCGSFDRTGWGWGGL